MGGTRAELPEPWGQADPSTPPFPTVPTLVVHPLDDQTIPVARSRHYVDACQDAGAPVTLAAAADEGHMHVILPTSRSWAQVESWLGETRAVRSQRPNR
jgi:acetyl esterase/lipase